MGSVLKSCLLPEPPLRIPVHRLCCSAHGEGASPHARREGGGLHSAALGPTHSTVLRLRQLHTNDTMPRPSARLHGSAGVGESQGSTRQQVE